MCMRTPRSFLPRTSYLFLEYILVCKIKFQLWEFITLLSNPPHRGKHFIIPLCECMSMEVGLRIGNNCLCCDALEQTQVCTCYVSTLPPKWALKNYFFYF